MENQEIIEDFAELYRNYYRDELGELAQGYPKDKKALHIEAKDLYRYNQDILTDWINEPDLVQGWAEEALELVELPVDQALDGVNVHLTDSHGYVDRYGVGELKHSELGKYIAIRCQLGKVSERKPRLKEGAFECQRCGSVVKITQSFGEGQEPHECPGCDRQGPFVLDEGESDWVDQRKVRLEAPPEKRSGAEITGYCIGDVADPVDVNVQDKAGSRVTVLGKLEVDKSSIFGDSEPVGDEYFVVEDFVWGDNLGANVEVDDYRSEVEERASRDDAIDLFAHNIDPNLVVTDEWEQALEMGLVYLFGAPRIDPDVGATVRGDIHFLFVSDPGMNKSQFASNIAELSPKGVKKDAEGMSSKVGLTASATQGGFGDDSWSIEPGALPKANKGHLILDEIDKGPSGFLDGVHSPLEGEQTLNVEKAGQEATLATRCGFMALGNPVDGRVNEFDPLMEQIELHPALMSRFDLICTMMDEPDRNTDEEIAAGILDSVDESARVQHGDLDESDADHVSGEVPRNVMQAWVKMARQEIQPMLTDEAKGILRQFYVETRQLNGEDSDTMSATARNLMAGIRISMAYARCELSDVVEARHARRAKELSRVIVGETFDPESGEFDIDRSTETKSSQQQRVDAIKNTLSRADEPLTIEEISERSGVGEQQTEHRIEKMYQAGEALEPQTGEYRLT